MIQNTDSSADSTQTASDVSVYFSIVVIEFWFIKCDIQILRDYFLSD